MNPPLKLGFDNYALRSLDWKAPRLLEHAAALALDSVLFSDLTVLEHHSGDYLADLRAQASSLGLEIQVGTLSICPSSALWNNQHGSPADLLKKTIEIARALGSPVARCVLGNVQDRRSPGGIQARIAETVEILKSVRPIAVESGIQIALENHAGDLQARELVDLWIAPVRTSSVRRSIAATPPGHWSIRKTTSRSSDPGPCAVEFGIPPSGTPPTEPCSNGPRWATDRWIFWPISNGSPSFVLRRRCRSKPFPGGQTRFHSGYRVSGTPTPGPSPGTPSGSSTWFTAEPPGCQSYFQTPNPADPRNNSSNCPSWNEVSGTAGKLWASAFAVDQPEIARTKATTKNRRAIQNLRSPPQSGWEHQAPASFCNAHPPLPSNARRPVPA